MALNPLQNDSARFVEVNTEAQPSKTYEIDFENGRIGGHVDGIKAARQYIRKTLQTSRFRYLIYDNQYGCELDDLIGQDVTIEFLQSEIPSLIREALIYDDRFDDVYGFVITRSGDGSNVEFSVQLSSIANTTENVRTPEIRFLFTAMMHGGEFIIEEV